MQNFTWYAVQIQRFVSI